MSKLTVYTYANGRYLELDGRIKSVTISGDTTKAYRTASVELINAKDLRKAVLELVLGKELRVVYDKKELFRGVLMQNSINTDANTSLVAHDFNYYLTKNADSVNFKDKTADAILKELCAKFGIPTGNIASTGYVLPKFIKSGTIFEMFVEVLKETQSKTGKAYRLRNRNGLVELTDITQVDAVVTLKNGETIMSADFNESIEDIQTRVKLTGGDEKKPITSVSTAGNSDTYGVMQHYEHISDVKDKAELDAKAKAMVNEMSRPKTSVNVEALGNPDVMSGTSVGVIESMTKLSGTYAVEADTHNFGADGSYTMSLTLVKREEGR